MPKGGVLHLKLFLIQNLIQIQNLKHSSKNANNNKIKESVPAPKFRYCFNTIMLNHKTFYQANQIDYFKICVYILIFIIFYIYYLIYLLIYNIIEFFYINIAINLLF